MLTIVTQENTLVVDSRLIAGELDIEHRALRQTIEKYLTDLQGFGVVTFEMSKPTEGSQGGRPERFCYLNEDQAIFLMTLSRNTEKVVKCKMNLVKAFKDAKSQLQNSTSQLPQTYLDALKSLVVAEEEKQLLLAEKALLEQHNELLSETVDDLFNYSSIVRIAKFNHVHESNFKWHRLKATSEKMNLETKKVPDARYEYKLLYHHDVWRVAYPDVKLPETTTLVINQ